MGIIQNLNEIKVSLGKIAAFSTEYAVLLERISSLTIELDDISDEMNRCSDKLINDPEQLELISQKLQLIFNLQKKHQVSTVDELIEIQNKLENSLFEIGNLEEEILLLSNSIQQNEVKLDIFSNLIHEKRQEAIRVNHSFRLKLLD